jgi:hypothetical protein
MAAWRITPEGALDATFGVGGIAEAPYSNHADAHRVRLQADGKIVLAGGASISFNNNDIAVVRFLGDGVYPEEISIAGLSQLEGDSGTTSFVFTVSRTGDTSAATTVDWTTADGTATAASGDYVAASGQVTFNPGETTQTIVISVNGDTVAEADETFAVQLFNATSGTIAVGTATGAILNDETKFYVVNDAASVDRTYEYSPSGTVVENYAINSANSAPRGAASNAAGDKVWVVDANRKVYVYDPSGVLLGSWTAGTLASNANVQGIATNGMDIWIVDAKSDKVYRYTGAASRLSGSQSAASNFSLNANNKDASDLVTDGTSIWVLNNAATDKVFKYAVSGTLLGSWTINAGGGIPTGITIDPSAASHIWIVDSNSDRVYQFDSAASRTSGSQAPSTSFALAAGNANPQGLADPPLATARSESTTAAQIDAALMMFLMEDSAATTPRRK